jgi:hypothetical protein
VPLINQRAPIWARDFLVGLDVRASGASSVEDMA